MVSSPRSRITKMPSLTTLTKPPILFSRSAVLSKPCPVPPEWGVYAWFFKEIPGNVPTDGCISKDGMTLLYVGISPDKVGKPNSRQNLRKRITNHYNHHHLSRKNRRTCVHGLLLLSSLKIHFTFFCTTNPFAPLPFARLTT